MNKIFSLRGLDTLLSVADFNRDISRRDSIWDEIPSIWCKGYFVLFINGGCVYLERLHKQKKCNISFRFNGMTDSSPGWLMARRNVNNQNVLFRGIILSCYACLSDDVQDVGTLIAKKMAVVFGIASLKAVTGSKSKVYRCPYRNLVIKTNKTSCPRCGGSISWSET